jgi:NinB protein
MSRATYILGGDKAREQLCELVRRAPAGTRVDFTTSQRSLEQNARMWAMLTDVSRQLVWYGRPLSTADWKLIFMDALVREKKAELRVAPNIDGSGFVPLGRSSSSLTKREMGDLMELIAAFGAQHGVVFHDQPDDDFEEPTVGNEVV